jgi:hypothetical protein
MSLIPLTSKFFVCEPKNKEIKTFELGSNPNFSEIAFLRGS